MRRPLLLQVALLAGTITVAAADPPKFNDDPAAVCSGKVAKPVLSPAFFRAEGAPADANDYVVYNKATGNLFYDFNGNLPVVAPRCPPPSRR